MPPPLSCPLSAPEPRAPPSRRNAAVVSHAQYILTVTAAPASRLKAAVSKAAWWPWPLYLESSVRVTCDVGYLCANFSLPRPLCSRRRPDVRDRRTPDVRQYHRLIKVKGSSLDIAPLTILVSSALQPRKWQLTGTGCSTAAQASGSP